MDEQPQPVNVVLPLGLDGSFLDRLTEQLEAGANARAVFGEPIERDGITVIPVARARWGIGGGTGAIPDEQRGGTGAGGGLTIAPAGFIEICEGHAKFRPIASPVLAAAAILGGAALLVSALRTAQVVIAARTARGAIERRRFRRLRNRRR